MFDQDLIDSLLQQADIVDVVRHYLPDVAKKGKGYVARCPFHDDHDPSMQINPERHIFKCFVCGHGGNAIRFVQDYEKLAFPEAVRRTAELVGFRDPRLSQGMPSVKIDPAKQRLFDCIAALQAYYRYSLETEEGAIARSYLEQRHISPDQIEKYGIGYAPSDGARTVAYLQARGFSLKNIEDIGIATAGEGMRDRSAGRLTFPLFDPQGRVVGFSARQLVKDPNSGKYMNSPETPLFIKGNNLYNYHNVSSSAHHDGYVYLLEGFMDVMALDKAGLQDAIALMGTALTKEQIQLLRKLRCEVRLCLDGDEAGQTGMMKAALALTKAQIPFRVVDYGDDLRDPDDILQEEGKDALVAKMSRLIDALDFELNYYLRVKRPRTSEDKQAILRHFAPILASQTGIEKENNLAKLSKALDYDVSALRLVLGKYAKAAAEVEQTDYGEEAGIPSLHSGPTLERLSKKLAMAEDTLLHYLLTEEQARSYVASKGNPMFTALYRQAVYYILEYAKSHPDVDLAGLTAYVDAQEDGSDYGDLLTSIEAGSQGRLPFDPNSLPTLAGIIESEKLAKAEELKTDRAIESGDPHEAAAALAELAKAKRNRGAKK